MQICPFKYTTLLNDTIEQSSPLRYYAYIYACHYTPKIQIQYIDWTFLLNISLTRSTRRMKPPPRQAIRIHSSSIVHIVLNSILASYSVFHRDLTTTFDSYLSWNYQSYTAMIINIYRITFQFLSRLSTTILNWVYWKNDFNLVFTSSLSWVEVTQNITDWSVDYVKLFNKI